MKQRTRSRGPGRHVHPLLVATLAAAVALVGARPAQAITIPLDTIYVHYAVTATPRGSTTLCQGDVLKITAAVSVSISRSGPQSPAPYELTPGMYGAQVQAEVANPSVGSVFPASRPTGNVGGPVVANFAFTAGKPGHTRILFEYRPAQEDELAPLVPPEEDELTPLVAPLRVQHLRPTPASVNVEVKQCAYRISVVSGWVFTGDREIDALGYLTARVTPDQDGKFSTRVSMRNHASWVGLCPGSVDVPSSNATITGKLAGQRLGTRLEVNITYDTLASSTTEGCGGKSAQDTGTPDPLVFRLAVSGGILTLNHPLHGTQNAGGSSFIMVKRLDP